MAKNKKKSGTSTDLAKFALATAILTLINNLITLITRLIELLNR